MFGSSKKPEIEVDTAARLQELRAALSPDINEMVTDEDCHRFLAARKYDVAVSADLLRQWSVWYKTPFSDYKIENKNLRPCDLLTNLGDHKEHLATDSFLWSNTGEDKDGQPMYWEKIGYLAAHYGPIKQNFTEDELFIRHVRQQEMMVDRMKKASIKYGRPISKQTVVLDLKDLPFAPDRMGFKVVHRSVVCDQTLYPERLDRLFVINAPIYFTAIWAIVKPWIDAVTVRKIQIFGANYQDALREVIADDQLPVEYGGTKRDFPWHYPENNVGYNIDDTAAANVAKINDVDANTPATAASNGEEDSIVAEATTPVDDLQPDAESKAA